MNKADGGGDHFGAKIGRSIRRWSIVLVPALLTSLVALIPFGFEYYKKWSGDLNYEIISGPQIRTSGDAKRVTSIIVRNSGSSKVTDVAFKLTLLRGTLEEYVTEDRNGLLTKHEIKGGSILATAPAMHPTEQFSLTFMSSFPELIDGAEPVVSLRANELLGYEKASDGGTGSYIKGLLPALLAGLTVAGMGMVIARDLSKLKIRKKLFHTRYDRRERLLFISLAFSLPRFGDIVLRQNADITYRECGTIILGIAASLPSEERPRAIRAMSALLLNRMAAESRASIEGAITLYDKDDHLNFTELRERAESLETIQEFRLAVMRLVPAEAI